jgi:hypothetical protein
MMHERVASEIKMLKQRYPLLQHGDNLSWVFIPEFILPTNRYNKERAKLLFLIPTSYPNAGPDNFFTDGDLRLKDGNKPPSFKLGSNSSTGSAPIPGDWAWFSWHPVLWRPAATVEGGDNIFTFIKGINLCLRGEEIK